jgi:hypothetical protein
VLLIACPTIEAAVNMPVLVRKLLVLAAVDGLVLQPASPRSQPPATQQAIKIDYTGNIAPLAKDRRDEDTFPAPLESYGIVGTGTPFHLLVRPR